MAQKELCKEMKEGNKCSKNFQLKNRVDNISQLMQILETQPSIFWNHRPYPCAVVIQQRLIVLINAIKYGRIWEINRNSKKQIT